MSRHTVVVAAGDLELAQQLVGLELVCGQTLKQRAADDRSALAAGVPHPGHGRTGRQMVRAARAGMISIAGLTPMSIGWPDPINSNARRLACSASVEFVSPVKLVARAGNALMTVSPCWEVVPGSRLAQPTEPRSCSCVAWGGEALWLCVKPVRPASVA